MKEAAGQNRYTSLFQTHPPRIRSPSRTAARRIQIVLPSMAATVPITAMPKRTSPYCTSGATNADAQNRTYVPPPYPRSPRRYDSKPMIISRATSASMEYSRTSWACRIASTELAASRAAMKAAHRLTPKRGSQKRSAATVRTLATAGTMRTLRSELSTFCTAYKTSG